MTAWSSRKKNRTSGIQGKDSSEDEEDNSENDVGYNEEEGPREVKRRVDIDFSEETGTNVNARNLKSCLDFFNLFFTQEVWDLLVGQTNLYALQKRGPISLSLKLAIEF